MHIQKSLRITKGNNSLTIAPSPNIFIISISLVDLNVFARFDEIPSMSLQDIKKTKRTGCTTAYTTIKDHLKRHYKVVH